MADVRHLSVADRLKVWWRLFSLQASWNFETMQGVGLGYALFPGLKRLYRDTELRQVLQRYLGYFNTHPYMAAFVAGTALRLEEKTACGEGTSISARQFIDMVVAPFAAIGDALFWGGLRPLAAVVAVLVGLQGVYWAPLVFLLLFAVPRLVMSLAGFFFAYRQDLAILQSIQKLRLADWAVNCKRLLMLGLGGLTAISSHSLAHQLNISPLWGSLCLLWLVLAVFLLRRGMPLLALIWGSLVLYGLLNHVLG